MLLKAVIHMSQHHVSRLKRSKTQLVAQKLFGLYLFKGVKTEIKNTIKI